MEFIGVIMGLSDFNYHYYLSLLEKYSQKETLRQLYRDEYYIFMFDQYVERDEANCVVYDELFQTLLSLHCDVKKAPYGQGCHWRVKDEMFFVHVVEEDLLIENLRSSAHYSKVISHCNIPSLINYLEHYDEMCRKADTEFDKILSWVDYRLAHAEDEKRLDEQLEVLKVKCKKRVQQEKDCEKLKEEFVSLNKQKQEILCIPEGLESEKLWLDQWDALVKEYHRYWSEYREKQVKRSEVKKQLEEDETYRAKVKEMFLSHKVKPAFDSHYWIYYKPLANGQVLAFVDRLGSLKQIAKHGMKLWELLDEVVRILNKRVSLCENIPQKGVTGKRLGEEDVFLERLCRFLEEVHLQYGIYCSARSYTISMACRNYGLSFSVSQKEFPEGTEKLIKAVAEFLKYASKAKLGFELRDSKLRKA